MPNPAIKFVQEKIGSKKVIVFSKKHCGFCMKAKRILSGYVAKGILKKDDYEVIEIEERKDCSSVQDYMQELTGARSVPRVFIDGEFVGGGTEISRMDASGQLTKKYFS